MCTIIVDWIIYDVDVRHNEVLFLASDIPNCFYITTPIFGCYFWPSTGFSDKRIEKGKFQGG